MQVGDDVDAVLRLLEAHEAHLGAVDVRLGRLQEHVQVVKVPDRLLAREGGHAR